MGHANSHTNGGGHQAAMIGSAVRRLTPRECERLQGFPDDYTLINHRGKPAADGPRYKALGNSMAVPCMHWIGDRINQVDKGRE
jgi:DNA (cytosine-5)-methyltransferase 1